MLRLILFAFIGLYILTGTNVGKNFMAEHNLFEDVKMLKDTSLGNETIDPLVQEQADLNERLHIKDNKDTAEARQDEQTEPSLSKDEALTKVLNEFSMTELLTIVEKVKSGMTEEELEEIKKTLKERFSAEDLEALKELGKNEFEKYFNSPKEYD